MKKAARLSAGKSEKRRSMVSGRLKSRGGSANVRAGDRRSGEALSCMAEPESGTTDSLNRVESYVLA
ncbi:hypothetical protein [Herbaspirillum lusitanum]|uniref:hypothetical protein n=1 Tax=Herbaspirillum lusitanum TaxID=213312 RepID=UPI0012F4F4F1|nr:hypothetical protein [Herbaspirillum lusitanum]